MKLKYTSLALFIGLLSTLYTAGAMASDKPVQHLQLADVTTLKDANRVFFKTTSQLSEKNKLDAAELQEIHIITYSLEKAVAFFVENTQGEQQIAAKKMAEVIELVHIGSENNRAEDTKAYLDQYFSLAQPFSIKH